MTQISQTRLNMNVKPHTLDIAGMTDARLDSNFWRQHFGNCQTQGVQRVTGLNARNRSTCCLQPCGINIIQ
jgi:hypothetical protein